MSPEHEMPDPLVGAHCHARHLAMWHEPRGSVATR